MAATNSLSGARGAKIICAPIKKACNGFNHNLAQGNWQIMTRRKDAPNKTRKAGCQMIITISDQTNGNKLKNYSQAVMSKIQNVQFFDIKFLSV